MNRINISEKTNFIGSWNINNDNLCNNIVSLFENKKQLHQKGITSGGINEKIKKSTDIYIEPNDLNKDEFKDLKIYLNLLFDCYQDYKMQWPFLQYLHSDRLACLWYSLPASVCGLGGFSRSPSVLSLLSPGVFAPAICLVQPVLL